MSGHPPPPPPRKPPAPGGPKPPVAQAAGDYAEEPPPTSSTSTGMILAIVGAVLFLVIGLPILACVGVVAFGRYQATRLHEEYETQVEQVQEQQSELEKLREAAFLSELSDRLQDLAKNDIKTHWTALTGDASLRWRDWKARKVHDQRYEVSGDLVLSGTDVPGHHHWACEYSTQGDAKNPSADWTLQRIVIDSEQVFP